MSSEINYIITYIDTPKFYYGYFDINKENCYMENDNETKEVLDNQENGTASDYLKVINDLKNNTVSKEEYDKLREENKMLLNNIANNVVVNTDEEKKEEEVDINKLREDLFGSDNQDMTNLEYVTKVMELRKALMDRGERDPFLPSGRNILPTDEDIKTANRVAEVYQNCIDVADGNPDIFTQELQRVTVDVVPQVNKRR